MAVALVTGGSRGLGKALVRAFAEAGWSVVTDARDRVALDAAAAELYEAVPGAVVASVVGDVTDLAHRADLVRVATALGGLDVVVNNAGVLGPSPQPLLAEYPLDALRRVYDVNVVAQLGVVQAALPLLRRSPDPRVVQVTSDAAAEAYLGWGGYGSAKAALEQLGRVLALEEPRLRLWSVDPGDLATRMQEEAFPGEDVSDRAAPESVVGAFLCLVASDRPSGRYLAAELRARRGS